MAILYKLHPPRAVPGSGGHDDPARGGQHPRTGGCYFADGHQCLLAARIRSAIRRRLPSSGRTTSGWIRVTAKINPSSYVLAAMRATLNTGWDGDPLLRGLAGSEEPGCEC